jgi:protease secretion system outer membrane protein
MMSKNMIQVLLSFSLASLCFSANALSLLEAYKTALEGDASIRGARAALEAGRERLPQAKSQLMPSVSANVLRNSNQLLSTTANAAGNELATRNDYFSSNKTVALRQPLFNLYKFFQYKQAEDSVTEAEFVFERDLQNLTVRVVGAYLDALLSAEQVQLVLIQKNQYQTLLKAAEKALVLGTGTVTDIDEAQARLDMAFAQELEAKQNQDYTRRQLEILLNRPVVKLHSLKPNGLQSLPSLASDLDGWLDKAMAQSPEVKMMAARLNAANHEIKKAKSGHAPTLDAVLQWSESISENVTRLNSKFENKSIGFQMTIPLYQGGYVSSTERQAIAERSRNAEALEALRRDLSVRIHKDYRGVTEGVLKIRAFEQALKSSERLLDSTRKSFLAGVRSQLDVLNVEQQVSKAHQELVQSRYQYLMSRLRLYSLSGLNALSAVEELHSVFEP